MKLPLVMLLGVLMTLVPSASVHLKTFPCAIQEKIR